MSARGDRCVASQGLPVCGSGPDSVWLHSKQMMLLSLHNLVARAARARRPSKLEPRAHRYTGLATNEGSL